MKTTTLSKLLLHLQVAIVSVACFQSSTTNNVNAFVMQILSSPACQFASHNYHRSTTIATTLLRESGGGDGGGDNTNDDDSLSEPEQHVHDILQDLHDSDLPFRMVVVGNGAMLESTSMLGPVFKLGDSPRAGEPIVAFASDDQSFEFHVMTRQVSKIVLTEKTRGDDDGSNNVMQIIRFPTAEGKPMSSLMVADKSKEAQKWFASVVEKHGSDIQL